MISPTANSSSINSAAVFPGNSAKSTKNFRAASAPKAPRWRAPAKPQFSYARELRSVFLWALKLRLKNGLDFCVDGNMSGWKTVDRKRRAGGLRKMEEAGDVIVLVVAGEEPFGFRGGKRKRRKSHGNAEADGNGKIAID